MPSTLGKDLKIWNHFDDSFTTITIESALHNDHRR